MSSKQYDYRSLLLAYLETRRGDHIHEDFRKYYVELQAKLELCFNVHLPPTPSSTKALILTMLFADTVKSYLTITTPTSGFLESSLVVSVLGELGEQGNVILDVNEKINELAIMNQSLHLKSLYAIFESLYGRIDKVVASDDLQSLGFDDSQEPKISDYLDYV